MIVELPGTTTSGISRALVKIREEGGAVALGRVLTLVIATRHGAEEEAIAAANAASREHPMRVIVLSTPLPATEGGDSRLDAQIRVGGDAGASEVIVLRAHGDTAKNEEGLVTGLLLADAPVVAWWPADTPDVVSDSPIGRMAQCRITDAAAQPDPRGFLAHLARTYRPGDTDFAWTRLTLWRAQLAAVLDQPPFETITGIEVQGASDSPSTTLLAAWLQSQLKVPARQELRGPTGSSAGIHEVKLERASGTITLVRTQPTIVTLTQPGQPVHDISLPRRNLRDCLSEELRRLDPDDLFGDVLQNGLADLSSPHRTA
ncbi:glucose-6-phosphate dehydrogenase assembly protein OpcA [Cryobacterium mesophilum]|uniref:OpcA protein n=1 Tax=Terrimesophilobacter mesophilus TaxID=433647 RepID=A0A4V3I9B5_9MICO|nr:glucose-6-phosphate dehydrogenase assembly protein OpcA [Terrimesophilobacter mesophilus]MBB5631935.1 glucose-6-phosphate dehydrogenase assembly protein OpcA [Terrimesophilobacter mesophilus]TFB78838.1 OpcA protein [Terrimesophilobacter mesophilus]